MDFWLPDWRCPLQRFLFSSPVRCEIDGSVILIHLEDLLITNFANIDIDLSTSAREIILRR